MLLILPSGGKLIIQDQVSERIAYAPSFGLRAVILCFSFCSARETYYRRSGVRTDSLCSYIRHASGLSFFILPSGGKVIIQDQVSEG